MRAAHSEEINELKSQGFGENFRMKEELLTRFISFPSLHPPLIL